MARRGPNTPRGKAAVSRNTVKHGLRSGVPVIPPFESFEDWQDFRDGIIASYEPEGRLETELAERIASLLWRMKRAVNYETEMTAHNLDDIPDDLAESAAFLEQFPRVHARGGVTMDKIDVMVSARMLSSGGAMEKVMRGACPEPSHAHAADAEGSPISTAIGSRPTTSSRPSRACPEDGPADEGPAAKESAPPLSPASTSLAPRSDDHPRPTLHQFSPLPRIGRGAGGHVTLARRAGEGRTYGPG